MKKVISLILVLALLAIPALALAPEQVPSLICLDRKYNFLDRDNYIALSSGGTHVAMIDEDNSLWMFGSNEKGKLGIGNSRNAYNAPIKVLEGVKSVKARTSNTVAIKYDGSVWVFGKSRSATPEKIFDKAIDADCDGYLGYINSAGEAYFRDFYDNDTKLCNDAREIYVFYNYRDGDGLAGAVSDGSFLFGGAANTSSSIWDITSAYIIIHKNDGSLWEFPITLYSEVRLPRKVASDVKDIAVQDNAVTVYYDDGSLAYGSVDTGLSDISLADCVEYANGFYQKADGSLWYKSQNKCIGRNVKLWVPVASGTGVFMVHNDNSVSAFGAFDDFAGLLNTVNTGAVTIRTRERYDDIYAKTMELKGSAGDTYTIAKNISSFITEHIDYKSGYHDQSGVLAFREGTGVCAAFADLTQIMFSYLEIPTHYYIGENHAWNACIIDGVTVFIDNTAEKFDVGIFDRALCDSNAYGSSHYDTWASSEIRGAYDYELIDRQVGMDFRHAITRVNFCTLTRATIEKALGKDINAVIADMGKSGVKVPFTDSTHADVIAMYKLGIVGGTSPTTFHPGRHITRQEAAKIITGLAKTLGADTSAPAASFADSGKISSWAKPYVDFVNHKGIMMGKTTGFDPINTISVQESILICYRYLGNVIG